MTKKPIQAARASRGLYVAQVVIRSICVSGLGWWAYDAQKPASSTSPSSVTALFDDAVQEALRLGRPAVVEFGSVSCASCREMKPLLAQLARDHGERVTVADIDIVREREYIARYKIRMMPTQVFFDARGRETSRHIGAISLDEMRSRLGFQMSGSAR